MEFQCNILKTVQLFVSATEFLKNNWLREQSRSREANSHSAGQEIHRFMEPEGSSLCSQNTTGPYPEPDESIPQPLILFSKDPF
jgi:hypothetical protein